MHNVRTEKSPGKWLLVIVLLIALSLVLTSVGYAANGGGGYVDDPPIMVPTPIPFDSGRPLAPSEPPVFDEVDQEILDAVCACAAEHCGVELEAVNVLQAESVVWKNGALGCPQPGVEYKDQMVPGYHIILEVEGAQMDYRATEGGFIKLCEPQELLP